ncbi:hypothetical protein JCM10212_005688 [Sporobolomyces blumeae]
MGLKFKGDKPAKKRRSKLDSSYSSSRSRGESSRAASEPADLSGWVDAPSAALVLGPSYITLAATPLNPAVCLALQPTTGKVYPFVLPATTRPIEAGPSSSLPSRDAQRAAALAHLDPDELEALVDEGPHYSASTGSRDDDLATLEPSDVHHVWVCTRVPDTNDKVTFRSGSGKFLASDEVGVVTADREARGPQEEWTIEQVEGGGGSNKTYWLKNMYGKCLSVDVVAGGKVELRCDGEATTTAGDDEAGATERWRVTMQGEFLAKARKQYDERNGIKTREGDSRSGARGDGLTIVGDLAAQEKDNILKYQARGMRKYVGTEEDTRDLRRARKEGKLSEAMLDRRTKLKSDRYC